MAPPINKVGSIKRIFEEAQNAQWGLESLLEYMNEYRRRYDKTVAAGGPEAKKAKRTWKDGEAFLTNKERKALADVLPNLKKIVRKLEKLHKRG